MPETHDATASGSPAILDFWFGPPGTAAHGLPRSCWFEKNPAFDAEVRRRFLADWEAAAAGRRDAWLDAPRDALALVILLDQFPRNMFRGEARAFASDARALRVASRMIDQGFDCGMRPVERWFIYLPFEHAESLAMQERSLALFGGLLTDADSSIAGDFASAYDYARRHHAVIARFGRFPHRNAVLGRASTPEEQEFLRQPGSGF
jgi:uncharacterized protein (DUF924 family)